MWVRSQDRKRLLNLNGYNIYKEKDLYQIIGFDVRNSNNDIDWVLGEYSKKEKAIKVLNMIQQKIIEIDKNKFYGREMMMYTDNTFQMPQDDEVE